jgi:hypothetical protein
MGPQGLTGPAGTTDWNGLNNIPAGFADNIDNDTLYTAGAGLNLSGNQFSIPNSAITTLMLQDESVTAAKIANRTRQIFISPGEMFTGNSNTFVGRINTTSGSGAVSALGVGLNNNASPENPYASMTFIVPADYIAGAAPNVQILYGTDNNSGNVTLEVFYSKSTDLTGSGSQVTFRGNVSAPQTGNQIQTTTVSVGSPPTWNPGDVIILNVQRLTNDPNSGNVYIYGVKFDYTADQ